MLVCERVLQKVSCPELAETRADDTSRSREPVTLACTCMVQEGGAAGHARSPKDSDPPQVANPVPWPIYVVWPESRSIKSARHAVARDHTRPTLWNGHRPRSCHGHKVHRVCFV
eukprot:scaffold618_cov372-Prasinococcus_capsulatus_cf.AAC.3